MADSDFVREFNYRLVKACDCQFTPEYIDEYGTCMTGNDGVLYCIKCDKAWKKESIPDVKANIDDFIAGKQYDKVKDRFIDALQDNFLVDIKMRPLREVNNLVETNIDAFAKRIIKDYCEANK
jgi:hypothetical protein